LLGSRQELALTRLRNPYSKWYSASNPVTKNDKPMLDIIKLKDLGYSLGDDYFTKFSSSVKSSSDARKTLNNLITLKPILTEAKK
jgi:hypothetical protein